MIFEIVKIVFILLSAIILHEYAHGWAAYKLGDPTAKNAGRLTLNPIKHVDPIGTILLPTVLLIMRSLGMPVFIFGWAKPVPVNFTRLHNPKTDMIWVGIAGPVINIFLALIFSICIKLNISPANTDYFIIGVFVNLLLAVFNMMPVPPLDGSRLVMGLLPNHLAYQYSRLERYGILIIFILLYLGLFQSVVMPIIDYLAALLGVNLG